MATEKKGSHTWSILTGKDKRCFVTGRENGLQKHHIFHGSGKREISDRNGFWCYLIPEKHLAGLGGLHANPGNGLDRVLKCICQREYEKTHSREEFIDLIGKNYIMLDLEEAAKSGNGKYGGGKRIETVQDILHVEIWGIAGE